MNFKKYRSFPSIDLPNRRWPEARILKAPDWCSVDLRDGNQAIPVPMNVDEKIEFFNLLTGIGFKQIEVGFPSASETEFKFIRELIEGNLIPGDVTVQVLVQAREQLIEKTFESLEGAGRAIVHLYNSTSSLQRRVVFNKSREEIIDIAVKGTKIIKKLASALNGTEIIFEYSPESFTGTELDYAKEICDRVIEEWGPEPGKKVIINLPNTVEMATPNIYADQVEWMNENLNNRGSVILSVHTHNDRGTSVAASELAILAGAERVEGTLYGNGERTGNSDILTLAMNLFSQGIDPCLDFSDINRINKIYEKCMKLPVHARHPYAGELVYTAFSGSHQDAIRKGLEIYRQDKPLYWEVPYLPIDPSDVGRQYEAIIRINSQSGKGGIAYIMEQEFGFRLPKDMHPEFANVVQKAADKTGNELKPEVIYDLFKKEYLDSKSPLNIIEYMVKEKENLQDGDKQVFLNAKLEINSRIKDVSAGGNGPIDAFFTAIKELGAGYYQLVNYDEHALTSGSDSKAVSYIQLKNEDGGKLFGVGIAENITTASLKAIVCAINRFLKNGSKINSKN